MSEKQLYDFFSKGKDLKYASYWNKVEKFLANPSYLLNYKRIQRKTSSK